MTDSIPSTSVVPGTPLRQVAYDKQRIEILASVIEHLTDPLTLQGRLLAEQANWVACQIEENSDDQHTVVMLAAIGLELSKGRDEEDDMLGQELFFLFSEIAEVRAVERQPH
jgi:hypothetical protein